MNKDRALNLYNAMKEDPQYTQRQINNVCEQIRIQHGIDVFAIINKGVRPNKYRICEYGGNSSGGRLGAQEKSIWRNQASF